MLCLYLFDIYINFIVILNGSAISFLNVKVKAKFLSEKKETNLCNLMPF